MTPFFFQPARIFMVFIATFFAVLGTGCGQQSSDSPVKGVEIVGGQGSRLQKFLGNLKQDCMTLTKDPEYLKTDPKASLEKVTGYCTCFSYEFKEQFSSEEIERFLQEETPLAEEKLEKVAAVCSIHLEDLN